VVSLTNWQLITSKRKGIKGMFDGRHFDREIIVLCVRWYLRYKFSLRDLVEMMAERGVWICPRTSGHRLTLELMSPPCA
jgi:hypothetical protein